MNINTSYRIFVVISALFVMQTPVQAVGTDNAIIGIHIHSEGAIHSGEENKEMKMQVREESCDGKMAKPTEMQHATHKTNNFGDMGHIETDEYYDPSLKMHAKRVKTKQAIVDADCQWKVTETSLWTIRHSETKGTAIEYKQKEDDKAGIYWLRSLIKSLPSIAPLPLTAYPGAQLSAVRNHEQYAGPACAVQDVSIGPEINVEICLLKPKESHSDKMVSGGFIKVDELATRVSLTEKIPIAYFYPPKGANIVDKEN